MHRATMHFHPGLKRALMRMQAGKRRQQRWVDIDNAARIAIYKTLRKDAHKPGEHNKVRIKRINFCGQRRIKGLAADELLMVDNAGRDIVCIRERQTFSVGPVANDGLNVKRQLRLDKRLHVAAAPGYENDKGLHARLRVGSAWGVACGVACGAVRDAMCGVLNNMCLVFVARALAN